MPKNQTLGEMIKLGDLPLEEREQISDSIIYSAEHQGEFYTEVNHEKLDENKTSMTFLRTYLPEIDKNSDRYKNGLIEGVTPDAEELNEAEFTVRVKEMGWYFTFTKKAVNHSWLDIKKRCSKYLQNLFKTYHDEKIADTYLKSANTVTGCNLCDLKDLQRLNTILFKNGAVPFGSYYKLVVAPEVGDAMLFVYKDILTHTTEKNDVVTGEIGEVAGFRIIKSRLQAFAFNQSTRKSNFVAYGMTQSGEYPVSIVAYDGMADDVVLTPWGGLGNDPLKQRGAVGLYLDGHGFFVKEDAVLVSGECADVGEANISSMEGMDFTGSNNADNRSNLVASGKAREIIPEYDYVKMYLTASGSSAKNTITLKAVKPDGTPWTLGVSAHNVKVTSLNTSIATVSGATVTAVKPGVATMVLESVDNANIKTVVAVEVVDGKGDGIIAD